MDAQTPNAPPVTIARAPTVAVLIPCLNEAVAIGNVVKDFRRALPDATIFVYDNGSTDQTAAIARAAGAVVRQEPLRGKGNVMRRMFADVEADVYVLVDGDDTYDASSAPKLVEMLITQSLDMVNAARKTQIKEAYRPGHRFGNLLLTHLVTMSFGNRLTDLLSGYRVLSRRFIKSFPALASGFEIETELSIHALQLRMPIAELEVPYKDRPEGSTSNLSTYTDGFRILRTIVYLVKEEKPFAFFSIVSALTVLLSLGLGIPIIVEFGRTGLVPRLSTALLSSALMILSFLAFACGLILDTVSRGRVEMKRLSYRSVPVRLRQAARADSSHESTGTNRFTAEVHSLRDRGVPGVLRRCRRVVLDVVRLWVRTLPWANQLLHRSGERNMVFQRRNNVSGVTRQQSNMGMGSLRCTEHVQRARKLPRICSLREISISLGTSPGDRGRHRFIGRPAGEFLSI
jgi:glycosyltransferase involved in cell wall biosynthesis